MTNKLLLLIAFVILSISCTTFNNTTITGWYEVDKYVGNKTPLKAPSLKYLNINIDNTFELYDDIKKNSLISGKWNITKHSENEVVVTFYYTGKKTEAILRGNIFYFTHPNGFNAKEYSSVLYVKTNKKTAKKS